LETPVSEVAVEGINRGFTKITATKKEREEAERRWRSMMGKKFTIYELLVPVETFRQRPLTKQWHELLPPL
jgi:hypothetical protein